VLACIAAGLYPSVCRVVMPPKFFAETMSGSLPKDVTFEDIRYVHDFVELGF
jgi:hypothetical protein